MPLKPGDRIERYVIDGLLGSGGMGEVYRAHDPRLKRAIALKILTLEQAPADPSRTSSPASGAAARMMREAQLAASLDHPNVVAIFDVGQIEEPAELRGTTYLAMELIRGAPLRRFIGDPNVRMKVRVRWLEEIASALGAAHAAGLVHRDVKPENVMIRDDGHVKVLDFGIAKRTVTPQVDATSSTEGLTVPTMTAQGVIVGTPMYMAPEQLRAEALDGRADQFAWGVVAYELLTGKPLWSAEGGGYSLVAQILQASPPSLSAVAGVEPRVAATVARALMKDPEARFASMGALVAGLTGRSETDDTEPKIQVRVSSPDLEGERRLSAAPTQYGEASAPSLPPTNDTKRSALVEERQSTTKRGTSPAGRPRAALAVGAVVALGVVALAAAHWRPSRSASSSPPPGTSPSSETARSAVVECTHHTECVRKLGGVPAVCNPRGACAKVESRECTAHHEKGDLERDDTVWIGGMFAIGGNDPGARIDANAMELGRRDFASALGSYRPPVGSPSPRPLATVVCDSTADADEAARHLVEDVGVPAIIDGQRSGAFVEIARSRYVRARVLALATEAISPSLTSIENAPGHPRLVYRTTYNSASVAEAIAAFTPRLEASLRKSGSLPPKAELRVALLRTKSPAEDSFAEVLFGALVFNGKSALDNGKAYVERPFDGDAETDGACDEIARLGPQVIIVVGPTAVIPKIEERWGHGARPTYLIPTVLGPGDLRFIGRSADRRGRVFGFTVTSTRPGNARLVVHYNESFPERISRSYSPNTTYDAFYALAFGVAALTGRETTGEDLAQALARLGSGSGKSVDVGPNGIYAAYGPLSRGESMHLVGSAGGLDFDPATGDGAFDLAVLCADVDSTGAAVDNEESGLVYSSAHHALEGVMRCP